ncbi:MAG: metallophosphoesterase family protein [Bacteroidales bacterium]|nr:metallophosphoesterase family protein [Bacteroidales bacterium]
MTRIGVMSDSHGRVAPEIFEFFKDVDIILHAGDIGSEEVLQKLREFKKVTAVYGNCDNRYIDAEVKGLLSFRIEQTNILMTHIGGYPKHYDKDIIPYFASCKPDIFICGHSHILRIMYDKDFKFLLVNPGACGHQGFHQVCTLVRFVIDGKEIKDMEVMDFNKF